MNTAADLFYTPEDVMALMNYSRSKAYKVIADLNQELADQGFMVRRGMISKRYFNDRFAFTLESAPKRPGPGRPPKDQRRI